MGPSEPPARLLDGRYQLQGNLGAGGMGCVYDAYDLRLGRRVAVKVLTGAGNQDSALCERLFREAKAAARANHPAVITVFGFGNDAAEGLSYLVMERLEGEDLGKRLEREQRLELSFALHIGVELADALAAVHSVGVVHRDLKPSNVFLTTRGMHVDQVKLLDFGLAKLTGLDPLTATGEVFGTLQYMAPEQLQDAKRVDALVDVYALGALLYECLSGHSPVRGDNAAQLVANVLFGQVPDLAPERPELPAALCALVMQCLGQRKVDRPASASHVRDALCALQKR